MKNLFMIALVLGLFAILVILKLTGVDGFVDASWWFITFPFWAAFIVGVIYMSMFIPYIIYMKITRDKLHKKARKR